jgi:O-antigen ligase
MEFIKIIKGEIKRFVENWNFNDWCIAYLLIFSMAYIKLAAIGIVVFLLVVWFNREEKKPFFKRLLNFRQQEFWFVLFFLVHILGMFWSENTVFGISDISMKLSFFILPTILLLAKINITAKQIQQVFLFGLTFSLFLLYSMAIFKSIYNEEDNRWEYFLESEFSGFMHRSYYATYLSIGAVISFVQFFNLSERKIYGSLFFLFSFSLLLTMSKAGVIVYLFSMLILIFWLFLKKKMFVIGGITIIGLLSVILTMGYFNLGVSQRLYEMVKTENGVKTINNSSTESNNARIIMWSTSLKVIKENLPFGTGTGDIKDELIKKNISLNNMGVVKSKLNSHNQFLNSAVQLGILGIIAMCGIFITQLYKAISLKSVDLFLMTFIFILSFLVESFLETQAGIIPFTLMSLLFYREFETTKVKH